MTKNIPSYMVSLSDGNFEVLEELLEEQYNSFISLYWMICDYSKHINNLTYKTKKDNNLKIEIEFKENSNVKDIVSKIKEDYNENLKIACRKNKVTIEIEK